MKNYVKKGLAAVAALAMALVLVPARPAEAKTKKGPRTETKYSIVDGKKVRLSTKEIRTAKKNK